MDCIFFVLKRIWAVIVETARKYNVQLFITTHSYDTLKAIDKTFDRNDGAADFSFYKLVKKVTGENDALYYPFSDFDSIMTQENDIR